MFSNFSQALLELFVSSLWETVVMVSISGLVGALIGIPLGVYLRLSDDGGVLQNPVANRVVGGIVNAVRSTPFIILLVAIGPLTLALAGRTIGSTSMIVPLSVAATFGFSRIVEQNLVGIDPGVIEAARATGASRWRIVATLLVPEALGPLVLGYTFLFVALIDMSAVAGIVAGGGLGDFALQYGYRRWNYEVIWITVGVIVVVVQIAQAVGNRISRRVLRR